MITMLLRKLAYSSVLLKTTNADKSKHLPPFSIYNTIAPCPKPELEELCRVVSNVIGGLDDLESSLNACKVDLTSSLVIQVIDQCKAQVPTRRLLRFFTWSSKILKCALEDTDFNYAIRVMAKRKDHKAIEILLSDLQNQRRVLDSHTFSVVADTLVKLGKEDDALGIFKNLYLFKCPQDKVTVSAIVNALCAKGHARRAEGVVWHHKDKLSGVESTTYRALLYGWSFQENVKEARRILQEIKSNKKLVLDLYCYNTFLRCLCEYNLKHNQSGLVPETLNVMMEMRSYKIAPNSISFNILLSCLGRARRVKESLNILESMKRSGCEPDWVTYYLITRVLFLTGRFGKGNQMVEQMIQGRGLQPPLKFYYDLIGLLCGVERVNHALALFERMKTSSAGGGGYGYGPVYDVLITKLCKGGDFVKGRELWNEAMKMGIPLSCPSSVLDPSVTEVFVLERKEDQSEAR
ncbi:hypothetical protein Dimus_023993 [Dionaea muscipula]